MQSCSSKPSSLTTKGSVLSDPRESSHATHPNPPTPGRAATAVGAAHRRQRGRDPHRRRRQPGHPPSAQRPALHPGLFAQGQGPQPARMAQRCRSARAAGAARHERPPPAGAAHPATLRRGRRRSARRVPGCRTGPYPPGLLGRAATARLGRAGPGRQPVAGGGQDREPDRPYPRRR